MKNNYDLKKLRKREGEVKVDPEATKTAISIKLSSIDLGDIKIEAERRGMPYQTLINSILHMYVSGELVDRREIHEQDRMRSESA